MKLSKEHFKSRIRLVPRNGRKINRHILQKASARQRADPKVVLAAVSQHGLSLQYASRELRGKQEIVEAAVSNQGRALEYAAKRLRGCRQTVMRAVSQNWHALQHAELGLRDDPEIVMAAVRQNALALRFAGAMPCADREILLTAVSICGRALAYASEDLRNDREVVLLAVSKHGLALRHASEKLCGDPDIVRAAVSQSGEALAFASADLKANRDIVLCAVKQSWLALRRGDSAEEFCRDQEILAIALSQPGCDVLGLVRLAGPLCNDRDIMLAAVANDWRALSLAPEVLRADPELVKVAACKHGMALEHASPELLRDTQFWQSIVPHLADGLLVFRIGLVSGRSCIVVVIAGTDGDNTQTVVKRAAYKLRLGPDRASAAQLLLGSHTELPEVLSTCSGLVATQINDLTLVISSA